MVVEAPTNQVGDSSGATLYAFELGGEVSLGKRQTALHYSSLGRTRAVASGPHYLDNFVTMPKARLDFATVFSMMVEKTRYGVNRTPRIGNNWTASIGQSAIEYVGQAVTAVRRIAALFRGPVLRLLGRAQALKSRRLLWRPAEEEGHYIGANVMVSSE